MFPSALRIASTAFVLAAAIATVTGCEHSGEPEHSRTESYDFAEPVASLSVSSKGGRIELVAAAGSATRVTETIRYTSTQPATRHELRGGQLALETSECSGDDNCWVDYLVEVPAGVTAHLDSAGGDIQLHALSGDIDVASGGGRVRADAMTGQALVARTDGGSVDLAFTIGPRHLELDTAGGDAVVRVPNERYNVDTDTDGGDDRIQVQLDPASPNSIAVRTGGGSASVEVAAS